MKRFTLLTLLAALLLAALPALAQDDAPPTPINVGDEVSGELNESVDEYVVSLTAGQVIVLDIFSEAFEPAAEITDADGFSLVSDFGSDTRSSVVFAAPEDGDYILVAGEFMGETTGAYTLRVREAGVITPDEVIEADVDRAPDAYIFEGVAGTLISASYTPQEFEAELQLYDSQNNLLASATQFGSDPAVLEYVLPEDGFYTLVAGLWFAADPGEDAGPYTLSYSEIIPEPIEYDSSVTVSMEGTARQYYAFGGNTGDTLHITADSGTTDEAEGIDVDLVITGPNGEDIFDDRSDGVGFDPALTRVMLPQDGFYLIKVIPNDESDETQMGDVTLTVETAELLTFADGPVSVTLGDQDRFEQDVVRFEGEPGTTYLLTVTPERNVVSYTVTIGEGFFSSTSIAVNNGNATTLSFTVPEDAPNGLVPVSIRQSAFQDTATYELTLEPQG